jgi:hypothetical protein
MYSTGRNGDPACPIAPLVSSPLDPQQTLASAGQIANQFAAQRAFSDYLSHQSNNTLRAQAANLSARIVITCWDKCYLQ